MIYRKYSVLLMELTLILTLPIFNVVDGVSSHSNSTNI